MSAAAGPILVIGNSDGIGLATTRRLLGRGETVVGVSRRASPVDHPEYRHHVQGVTEPGFPSLLERIGTEHPDLRRVVHCAGVGIGFDPDDLSAELRCFRTNLISEVETAAWCIPQWRGDGGGHLVVLSSLVDGLVVADSPSYCASKAGLSRYLRSLGLRVRADGIAVTNIRFGFVDTKMAKARWKPFEISAERAAEVVIGTLRGRPAVRSAPRSAALLTSLVAGVQRVGLGAGRVREFLMPRRFR